MLLLLVLLALRGSPTATALGAPETAPPRTPAVRVLTSFLPVHSLALAVAGDRARVENWLPQGVDPHDFQFSPRDLRRLATADVLVVGGLGLEGWKEAHLREASGNPRLRLVEAAAGLPTATLIEGAGDSHHHEESPPATAPDHDHAHPPNPHFWLDPVLAAHAVTNIVRALVALDPAGTATYEANGAAQVARLQALDREFATETTRLRGTAFLTVHNAFPYLARRYSLRLVGVIQATGNEEPSARELADLSRTVREEGVKALFNDGKPGRLIRRLAEDWKVRLATLETLETGDLGPGAYEAGMRRNLNALKDTLGEER